MKAFIVMSIFIAAGWTCSVSAANGTILQTFPGESGPGYKACPDTTGAVGPNHVVDFADASFMVHDKGSGKVVMRMTMPDFWKSVQPTNMLVLVKPNDPPGTTRPPVKAVAGTTYYRHAKFKLLPWGNYSATCIDPTASNRLWTYQEYANSENDGQWCTAWASFQMNP